MFKSLISVLDSVMSFSDNLFSFFDKKRERDTQKRIDLLENENHDLKAELVAALDKYETNLDTTRAECDMKIQRILDDIEADMNPTVGKREIKG